MIPHIASTSELRIFHPPPHLLPVVIASVHVHEPIDIETFVRMLPIPRRRQARRVPQVEYDDFMIPEVMWTDHELRIPGHIVLDYHESDVSNTLTDILAGTSWYTVHRFRTDATHLPSTREAKPVKGAAETAEDIFARFDIPIAASPELKGLTLKELLRVSPEKACFIPFISASTSAALSISREQWGLAFQAAITGVGVTFILVAGAWVLQAIVGRPPWPDDTNKPPK